MANYSKRPQRVNVRITTLEKLLAVIREGDFEYAEKICEAILNLDYRKETNEKITKLMHMRNRARAAGDTGEVARLSVIIDRALLEIL